MSTFAKRAREDKRAEKARAKARRRAEKRDMEPEEPEIVSAESIIGDVRSVEEVLKTMEAGPHMPRSAAPIPSKLFIGSLSDDTTSGSLRAHFEANFRIDEAVVITDRGTGQSRNFGFVTATDRKDVSEIIRQLHDSELDGRHIVVRIATEQR